jgi:hypothetical protein
MLSGPSFGLQMYRPSLQSPCEVSSLLKEYFLQGKMIVNISDAAGSGAAKFEVTVNLILAAM